MEEIYKDIPGYEGDYQVSNMGNVKSLNYNHTNNEALLKQHPCKGGYLKVSLVKYGKRKNYKIHQLVAMAFLNHIPDGMNIIVNHIDNNNLNNCVDNLQLVSQRYNTSCHKTDVGITWEASRSKWKAAIMIKGKNINLGRFKNKQDALDAYQKALKELDGKKRK